MNYIRHLSSVFEKMDAVRNITPYHISLYMALFRRWNLNFFNNPISVARSEVMKQSRIGSANTYLKTLKELHNFGFIDYQPSKSKHRGSIIHMYRFDNTGEQDVRRYKNYYKTNTHTIAKKNKNSNQENMKDKSWSGYGPDIPPSGFHVQIYFDEKGYPACEAEKFFNYYESNGWLLGGKSKMKDWKAAARNWILNIQRFKNNAKKKKADSKNENIPKKHSFTNGDHYLNQNKDYGAPL